MQQEPGRVLLRSTLETPPPPPRDPGLADVAGFQAHAFGVAARLKGYRCGGVDVLRDFCSIERLHCAVQMHELGAFRGGEYRDRLAGLIGQCQAGHRQSELRKLIIGGAGGQNGDNCVSDLRRTRAGSAAARGKGQRKCNGNGQQKA